MKQTRSILLKAALSQQGIILLIAPYIIIIGFRCQPSRIVVSCLAAGLAFCYNEIMNNYVLCEKLLSLGGKRDIPLGSLTTFKIGGPAGYVLEAADAAVLKKALSLCAEAGCPVALIGNGSNLLAPDEGFSGVVIKAVHTGSSHAFHGRSVTAYCGESLTALAAESVRRGLSGMERLCGIPGTVGGACAMNAGAYGGEIKDVLCRVHVFTGDGDIWEDVNPALLGYRRSPYTWPERVVLEAELCLKEGDGTEAEVLEDCLKKRRDRQPLEYPSAGSVFKRPEGFFAGKLIEDAGLKGFSIGGAQVSEKHAGFIINRGGATEKDVLALIEHIQNTVFKESGIELQPEIKRFGETVCTF